MNFLWIKPILAFISTLKIHFYIYFLIFQLSGLGTIFLKRSGANSQFSHNSGFPPCGLRVVYRILEGLFSKYYIVKGYRCKSAVGSDSKSQDYIMKWYATHLIRTVIHQIEGADLKCPRSRRIRSIAIRWFGWHTPKRYYGQNHSRPLTIQWPGAFLLPTHRLP
jgi:hypothetical protein